MSLISLQGCHRTDARSTPFDAYRDGLDGLAVAR